jgi:hypothetical protein
MKGLNFVLAKIHSSTVWLAANDRASAAQLHKGFQEIQGQSGAGHPPHIGGFLYDKAGNYGTKKSSYTIGAFISIGGVTILICLLERGFQVSL